MQAPDIHLYTAATMNGYKPVIFLEEAGVPYDLTFINFAKREQKANDYVKLNPNGRIPTIVDRSNDISPSSKAVPSFGTWLRNTGSFCQASPRPNPKHCNG